MTQEEKARAYDKALKRAKKEWSNNLDNAYKNYRERLEYIFHELKESEDDRIREELIEHIKANCESDFILFKKFSPNDVIAWLEKQGKQRSNRVGTKVPTGTLKEMLDNIDPTELEKTKKEMLEIDGFDSELNTLLKKYEHLPKEEIANCVSFYIGFYGIFSKNNQEK